MSWRDRLPGFLKARQPARQGSIEHPTPIEASILHSQYSWRNPPKRNTRALLELYAAHPWLRGIFDKISTAIAATTWTLEYATDAAGKPAKHRLLQKGRRTPHRDERALARKALGSKVTPLESHPLLDFLDAGNPLLTGVQTQRVSQLHAELVGEWFWLLERNQAGMPVGAWPIPPSSIWRTPTPDSPFYHILFFNWQAEIPASEILWYVEPDPLNPYGRGCGLGGSLADPLETYEFASKHLKAFFYNDCRPGLIVTGETLGEAEADRLEAKWNVNHRGLMNAFRGLFTNRKLDVTVLPQNYQQLELTKLRDQDRNTILQVCALPPEIMGILESSNRACYDEATECLTARGWVGHSELRDDDQVAAYDPARRVLRFERPRQIVRYPYAGQMLHFTSPRSRLGPRANVDMCVTPDHRMLVRPQRSLAVWREERAEQLERVIRRKDARRMIVAAPLDAPEPPPLMLEASEKLPQYRPEVAIPVEVWAPMLGLLVSEGTWGSYTTSNPDGRASYQIAVSQSEIANPEKVAAIDALVARFPIACSRYVDSEGAVRWQWNHRALLAHLMEHCGQLAPTKRLPAYVRTWPGWAQRLVVEWAILGDGTPVGRGDGKSTRRWQSWQLVSTSRRLLEDMQEAAVKGGLRAGAVRLQYEAHGERVACYRIGISAHVEPQIPLPTRVPYDGTVWCLETSTGWFVTRRNGCVAIQGNTIETAELFFAAWVLLPRLEARRAFLQERLVPLFDERLVLDYESPVREDRGHKLAVMQARPEAFSADEYRAEAGLDPLPKNGGQVYFVPGTVQVVRSLDEGSWTGAPGAPDADTGTDQGEGDAATTSDLSPGELSHDVTGVSGEPALPSDPAGAKRVRRLPVQRKAIRQDEIDTLLAALDPQALDRVIVPTVRDTVDSFGSAMTDQAQADVSFDLGSPAVLKFLRDESGTYVKGINDTTLGALRDTLSEGVDAGESTVDLAARIGDVFDEADGSRAMTIARTEVGRAANFGATEGISQAGFAAKTWNATLDDRTRDAHAALHQQTVPVDEPFVIPDGAEDAGAEADYPGDFGIPEQDINCRCFPTASDEAPEKAAPMPYGSAAHVRAYKAYDRKRTGYERQMRAAVQKGFRAQRSAVLDALDQLARRPAA